MGRAWHLVPVAALTWVAAALVTHMPSSAAPLAGGAGCVAVVALAAVALVRGRAARRGALVCLLGTVSVFVAAVHAVVAIEPRDTLADATGESGRTVTVTATVSGKVERWGGELLAFDAVTESLRIRATELIVGAPVQVAVHPDAIDPDVLLDVGATVAVRGTVRPTDPGERAVVRVFAAGIDVLAPPSGVLRVSTDLRRGLLGAVAGLPEDGAALVPGLAVGDTVLVSPALDAAMKESSLSHLTAVSGANCALVVGIAFAVAAGAGAGRGVRVAAGLAVLGAFVILVTPEPSVVRAATMAAIAMLAVLLGRLARGVAVLSLAVTAALALDPWLAGSLGFALSSAATASLLLFARPLASGLARWMPHGLALVVAVPLAAQLACGPLLILIAPSVPVYGVVANMLAGPAAPAVTVLGLVACLLAAFPLLQSGIAAMAWLPASWIAATATTVSGLPGNQLAWIEGAGGALVLAVVSGAIGLAVAAPVARRSGRLLRGGAVAVVAITVGVVGGTFALSTVLGRHTLPATWQVLACDVGQGDAILLRSEGQVALVDTGPDPHALVACLDRVGVERLALVVLTHFDIDHVGAASALVGRVGLVVHGPVDTSEDAAILRSLAQGGARVATVSQGQSGTLGALRWSVLWPRASTAVDPGNDASVVLSVTGPSFPSMLMLGDLGEASQRALLASASPGHHDVVKVAHHGSADQSGDLYARVSAAVGLFTVGDENDYGHPRSEALAFVTDNGGVIARTDLSGVIALWVARDGLRVWRERPDAVGTGG